MSLVVNGVVVEQDTRILAQKFRISTGELYERLIASDIATLKLQEGGVYERWEELGLVQIEPGDPDISFVLGHFDPDTWHVVDGEAVPKG